MATMQAYPVDAIISVEVTGKVAEVDGAEVNDVTMNESLPVLELSTLVELSHQK